MRPEALARLAAIALATVLGACSTGSGSIRKESAASEKAEAARVHTELGQKYMQQGKLEIALDNLNKALSYDADYADAHTVIAVLYERIGDVKQAEEHYRRAAQIKPKGGDELNNYGAFLCKIGRYDESTEYFERAIADPFYKTPDVALTNEGTCLLKSGKNDAAEAVLRKALDRGPNNSEALFQLASVLYQKGEFFKARAFMQRFEAVGHARPESLMLGRNIELRLGNGAAASDYTRRLLQSFPESQQARELGAQNS
ncbi:MAG TPA: type IV pilus biogenesis/stability protein PilW [Rhodanobacteraceae bacterium]|jgi:type IV pilus assembly protein PilF|nr:type IV pilus biogenesis/stability protein PilW [Rhodanobacteraceae bacterium]